MVHTLLCPNINITYIHEHCYDEVITLVFAFCPIPQHAEDELYREFNNNIFPH